MLIVGTTQITRKRGTGHFVCPSCGSDATYRKKSVQTFLTLYFIPVLPIGRREEFVECGNCTDAFRPDVVSLPPDAIQQIRDAAAVGYIAQAMTAILLEQPSVSDAVIETFRSIYERLSGSVVTPTEIRENIEEEQAQQLDAKQVMQHAANHIDDAWAARLVQAVFLIANVDGDPSPEQLAILTQLPKQLRLSDARFRELVAAASELGEDVFH